ncbi:MAG: hypothetical protein M3123_06610 [Actinomycetota bacterium]|nr:hypothetical protein [Actinomycetota bacterium]
MAELRGAENESIQRPHVHRAGVAGREETTAPASVRDSTRGRLASWAFNQRAYLTITAAWAASRVLVLVAAFVVEEVSALSEAERVRAVEHLRREPANGPLPLLGAWDGFWYQSITDDGYGFREGSQSNVAFFPLFPLAMSALTQLDLSTQAAGLVIANAAFLIGLFAFYELGKTWFSETVALRAAVVAAVFPMSVIFSMTYSEALSFTAFALSGLFAIRRRWLLCAIFAAAAALTRPTGVLIVLLVAAAALHSARLMSIGERVRALVAVLAAPAALGFLSAYFWWRFDDPLAYANAQAEGWGRSELFSHPIGTLETLFTLNQEGLLVDAGLCVFYLACLFLGLRKGLPRPWLALGALLLLIPLANYGTFQSQGRYGLLALPIYWVLALLAERVWVRRAVFLAGPALLAVAVAALTWRWP